MRKHSSAYLFLAVLTVVLLVLAACGGGEEAPTAQPTAAPTATRAPTATQAAQPTATQPTATSVIPTPTPFPTATPTPAAQRPIRGGVLRERINQDIERGSNWDSHQFGGIIQIRVNPNLYNAVLMTDKFKPSELRGDLAESWALSDNGNTITFRMRAGLKYHDGQPFKASDIIWSWKRITGEVNAGYISHINVVLKPYIKALEAPDDRTLVVRMNFPSNTFLYSTSNLFAVIYPERLGNAYLADSNNLPVGTGPFKIEERKPEISIKVRRNPEYFKVDASGEKLPYLDGIDFDIIRDSFTAFAAFRTGRYLQADFLDPGLLNNNIEQVKREFPDWTYGVGYGSWREYVFRNKAPFNDVRIRRALDMLIDRPAFVQVTAPGYGTHVASPLLPPELGGAYGLSAAEAGRLINIGPVTPERLAEAKKLFADAGVKFDGFTFEILSLGLTQYDNDTLVLVDQWKRAGLKPVFNNKPGPAGYGPKRIAGDFDLYYVPASSFGDDPDFVLGPFYPTGAGQNYGRWSDPKLDKLYSDQQREVDSAKRKQIAQDLQRYILTDAVWHPKVAWSGAWTAVSPRMRNHTALCPGAYCYRARVEDVWIAPEPAR